jgi:hypothetical protein
MTLVGRDIGASLVVLASFGQPHLRSTSQAQAVCLPTFYGAPPHCEYAGSEVCAVAWLNGYMMAVFRAIWGRQRMRYVICTTQHQRQRW